MSGNDKDSDRQRGGRLADPFDGVPDDRLGAALRARRLEAALEAAEAAARAGVGLADLLAFETGASRPDPLAVIRILGEYRFRPRHDAPAGRRGFAA
jgi:hypothetical protein